MGHEVRVPRLGWSMEEGIFIRWLKKSGESVRAGEPLFELEGEKATQAIESLDAGILYMASDSPAPGTVVAVGALLGYLLTPGEAVPVAASSPPADPVRNTPQTSPSLATATVRLAQPTSSPRAKRVA